MKQEATQSRRQHVNRSTGRAFLTDYDAHKSGMFTVKERMRPPTPQRPRGAA